MQRSGVAPSVVRRRDLGVHVTFRSATRELVTADLADAWSERFESLPPVRVPQAFKGQRNFSGHWWFASTRSHVAFESWLERDHLMLLDFAPEVTAAASQPFRLEISTSSGPRKHIPDYFVRMADGTGVVVDVRPDDKMAKDAEVFDATASACALVGWEHRLLGGIDPVLNANVRWLSGYRHPRCRTAIAADLLEVVTGGEYSISGLSRAAGDPVVVLPCLFHLLWAGELDAGLRTTRLSLSSPVRRARRR